MRVIERIEQLQAEIKKLEEKYCDYCQEYSCEDCVKIEIEATAEMVVNDVLEEQEYNPCQDCSDYDGAGGCYANGVRLPASWAKYQVWKEPCWEEQG